VRPLVSARALLSPFAVAVRPPLIASPLRLGLRPLSQTAAELAEELRGNKVRLLQRWWLWKSRDLRIFRLRKALRKRRIAVAADLEAFEVKQRRALQTHKIARRLLSSLAADAGLLLSRPKSGCLLEELPNGGRSDARPVIADDDDPRRPCRATVRFADDPEAPPRARTAGRSMLRPDAHR